MAQKKSFILPKYLLAFTMLTPLALPVAADEVLSSSILDVTIRSDNGAFESVIFDGFDNFNPGTPVSDYGFMLDLDPGTFTINQTTGVRGLAMDSVIEIGGTTVLATTNFLSGVYDLDLTRSYELLGETSVLVGWDVTNNGLDISDLWLFDTFDPDVGESRGVSSSFSTFNDVFMESNVLIGIASDSDDATTSEYTVAIGAIDPRAIIAAGGPFQIGDMDDVGELTGVVTAPVDGENTLADEGLHIVFVDDLSAGESDTYQYVMAFGTTPEAALDSLLGSIFNVYWTGHPAEYAHGALQQANQQRMSSITSLSAQIGQKCRNGQTDDQVVCNEDDAWFLSLGYGDGEFRDSIDITNASLTLGYVHQFSDTFSGGIALGVDDIDAENGSSSDLDGNSYSVSLFGLFQGQNNIFADGVFSFGRSDLDMRRSTFLDSIRSDTDSDNISAQARIGKSMNIANGFKAALYVGAEYFSTNLDGFDENGTGFLSATLHDVEHRTIRSILGASIASHKQIGETTIIPTLDVSWHHEIDQDRDEFTIGTMSDLTTHTLTARSLAVEDGFINADLNVVLAKQGNVQGGFRVGYTHGFDDDRQEAYGTASVMMTF